MLSTYVPVIVNGNTLYYVSGYDGEFYEIDELDTEDFELIKLDRRKLCAFAKNDFFVLNELEYVLAKEKFYEEVLA
jgi:hypothetical protein